MNQLQISIGDISGSHINLFIFGGGRGKIVSRIDLINPMNSIVIVIFR